MNVNKITATDFDQTVLKSPKRIVVDFYADWCGPCKMLAPVVEEMAQEHPDVVFAKLNVDEAPSVASIYGVMSIPTLIAFENGEVVGRTMGAQSKAALEQALLG